MALLEPLPGKNGVSANLRVGTPIQGPSQTSMTFKRSSAVESDGRDGRAPLAGYSAFA